MFRQYSFSFPTTSISASYFVQARNLGIIFNVSLSYIPHLNHQEILMPGLYSEGALKPSE